jgi:hypothetical protein
MAMERGIAGPCGPNASQPTQGIMFAGICFSEVQVDPQAKEVRLPTAEFADLLSRRFRRRELDRLAAECRHSMIRKDGPMAVVDGIRRPFAHVLLEQVNLVLAGGPREY